MKTRFLIIIVISIVLVAFFTANSFMNLYHYGEYLKIDDGNIWHCSSDGQKQFCDNTSIRMMELFGSLPNREHHPDQLEEIEGYAIDYDGEVKHLPFADVCTNPMKIILLSHSNIFSPDEEFVIEDAELPFGMNSEDFERCALETSFTKERSNMVEPYPAKCKSGPFPGDDYYFNDEECEWYHAIEEVPIRCGESGFNYTTGKCNPIID